MTTVLYYAVVIFPFSDWEKTLWLTSACSAFSILKPKVLATVMLYLERFNLIRDIANIS